jgi:LacI family transcriptional regulator
LTAIFAANDVMAFGVIRAIYEQGLKVPEDLSVMGFDNLELSGIIRPPLTTIQCAKYEVGQAAVELLLKLAQQKDAQLPEHLVFGVRLVERESCRPPCK